MSLFFGLRAYRNRVTPLSMGGRAKVAGLCVLTLCIIVTSLALAAYAVGHIFYGTTVVAAVLMLLMVTMAVYGTNAFVQKTLSNIANSSLS